MVGVHTYRAKNSVSPISRTEYHTVTRRKSHIVSRTLVLLAATCLEAFPEERSFGLHIS